MAFVTDGNEIIGDGPTGTNEQPLVDGVKVEGGSGNKLITRLIKVTGSMSSVKGSFISPDGSSSVQQTSAMFTGMVGTAYAWKLEWAEGAVPGYTDASTLRFTEYSAMDPNIATKDYSVRVS